MTQAELEAELAILRKMAKCYGLRFYIAVIDSFESELAGN